MKMRQFSPRSGQELFSLWFADSAANGVSQQWRILNGNLQMLHVHVLLVFPLVIGHMAQSYTSQHQTVGTLPTTRVQRQISRFGVQPFNDIVCTDTGSVLAGKSAVSQCFFNASLHFLGSHVQLHRAQFRFHRLAFSWTTFLSP